MSSANRVDEAGRTPIVRERKCQRSELWICSRFLSSSLIYLPRCLDIFSRGAMIIGDYFSLYRLIRVTFQLCV